MIVGVFFSSASSYLSCPITTLRIRYHFNALQSTIPIHSNTSFQYIIANTLFQYIIPMHSNTLFHYIIKIHYSNTSFQYIIPKHPNNLYHSNTIFEFIIPNGKCTWNDVLALSIGMYCNEVL